MNLYQLVSEELARLHELMKVQIQTQDKIGKANLGMDGLSQYGSSQYGSPYSSGAAVIWERIVLLQNMLMVALEKHDAMIQDKVAELALTGKEDHA